KATFYKVTKINVKLEDLKFVMLRVYFFFSSRRRHTRFSRDWSSDVCSSDLRHTCRRQARRGRLLRPPSPARGRTALPRSSRSARSEERRVGKECRSRWWADDEKKR